jgi:endogenous inhibitor of DNA gyrase (YacG/DUF329 family)
MSTIPKLRCSKCGHEWVQRTDHLPTVCPKCKNYDWNTWNTEEVGNGIDILGKDKPDQSPTTK